MSTTPLGSIGFGLMDKIKPWNPKKITKKQLRRFFKPSNFNWADSIDDDEDEILLLISPLLDNKIHSRTSGASSPSTGSDSLSTTPTTPASTTTPMAAKCINTSECDPPISLPLDIKPTARDVTEALEVADTGCPPAIGCTATAEHATTLDHATSSNVLAPVHGVACIGGTPNSGDVPGSQKADNHIDILGSNAVAAAGLTNLSQVSQGPLPAFDRLQTASKAALENLDLNAMFGDLDDVSEYCDTVTQPFKENEQTSRDQQPQTVLKLLQVSNPPKSVRNIQTTSPVPVSTPSKSTSNADTSIIPRAPIPLATHFQPPNLRSYLPGDLSKCIREKLEKEAPEGPNGYSAKQLFLAKVNTEWYLMSVAAKEREENGFRTRLEELEEANLLANWLSVFPKDNVTSSRWPKRSYVPKEEDDGVTKIEHERVLHHLNFFGQPVYEKSSTPPEVSLCVAVHGLRAEAWPWESRQGVIYRQASNFLDPFFYEGPQEWLSTMSLGELRNRSIGYAQKVYHPHGTWICDRYEEDDIRPLCSTEAGEPTTYENFGSGDLPGYRPPYLSGRLRGHEHSLVPTYNTAGDKFINYGHSTLNEVQSFDGEGKTEHTTVSLRKPQASVLCYSPLQSEQRKALRPRSSGPILEVSLCQDIPAQQHNAFTNATNDEIYSDYTKGLPDPSIESGFSSGDSILPEQSEESVNAENAELYPEYTSNFLEQSEDLVNDESDEACSKFITASPENFENSIGPDDDPVYQNQIDPKVLEALRPSGLGEKALREANADLDSDDEDSTFDFGAVDNTEDWDQRQQARLRGRPGNPVASTLDNAPVTPNPKRFLEYFREDDEDAGYSDLEEILSKAETDILSEESHYEEEDYCLDEARFKDQFDGDEATSQVGSRLTIFDQSDGSSPTCGLEEAHGSDFSVDHAKGLEPELSHLSPISTNAEGSDSGHTGTQFFLDAKLASDTYIRGHKYELSGDTVIDLGNGETRQESRSAGDDETPPEDGEYSPLRQMLGQNPKITNPVGKMKTGAQDEDIPEDYPTQALKCLMENEKSMSMHEATVTPENARIHEDEAVQVPPEKITALIVNEVADPTHRAPQGDDDSHRVFDELMIEELVQEWAEEQENGVLEDELELASTFLLHAMFHS